MSRSIGDSGGGVKWPTASAELFSFSFVDLWRRSLRALRARAQYTRSVRGEILQLTEATNRKTLLAAELAICLKYSIAYRVAA